VFVVTAMHPGDGVYRNMLVRLTDLAVTNDVIEGVTFENCTIVGCRFERLGLAYLDSQEQMLREGGLLP
jgi:hypothetical protein